MPELGDGLKPNAAHLLGRIAAALGRPEAAFFAGADGIPDPIDTAELLGVWRALKDDADRRKVLAFARAVAPERKR